MRWWRVLRDPTLSWMVPPYKTLEFWAVYSIWFTSVSIFADLALSRPVSLSLGRKIVVVAVLMGPIGGVFGLLRSHARIRRALRASPDFVSSESGKEFLKHASAIRMQTLVVAVALLAVVSLVMEW
jgi:hypothetical protein